MYVVRGGRVCGSAGDCLQAGTSFKRWWAVHPRSAEWVEELGLRRSDED